jgi:type II secretory pathway pseudopilin PulG
MEKFSLKKLNKKGYVVLFIVVIILVIVSIFGAVLSLSFTSRAKVSEFDEYREQALYLAEGVARELIYNLKYGQTPPPNPYIKDIDYSNYKGRGEATYTRNSPVQGQTTIKSTGRVPYNATNETKRTINIIIDSNFRIIYWEEETIETLP